ncbi:MAG: MBL fold metallo-hydrolase [Candidatus Levybacteria bacterium]|nr:MBL fold metallo-hydrolase [Candidatus Levybacteria bacterium]
MEHENYPPKLIVAVAAVLLFVLGGMFFYQQAAFSDGKLHVVFCDVGQGDAIFIRTPMGKDILVDGGPASPSTSARPSRDGSLGGPNDSVLDCLASHMPFWDRDIELMFLSHPHEDHLAGLISVIERYSVKAFATEKLWNKTAGFAALQDAVSKEPLKTQYLLAGDSIKTKDGVTIKALGPSQSYLDQTSPGGIIGEKGEFASLVLLVSYGSFDALLTGDSQAEGIDEATTSLTQAVDVLQVPHHGSKTGLTSSLVTKINPKLAIISVGKNKYGHPSAQALKILGDLDIKILRTDQNRSIQITSDGKTFAVGK